MRSIHIIQASHNLQPTRIEREDSRLPLAQTLPDTPLSSGNTQHSASEGEYRTEPDHKAVCGDERIERLFVYGTLKPNCPLHPQIARFVRAAHPASVEGVLVDLGSFPALLKGRGIVVGALLDVAPEALVVTDRIEGYRSDPQSCLYVRKSVDVTFSDSQIIAAWTYFFAHPEQIADRPRLVVAHENGISVYAWR